MKAVQSAVRKTNGDIYPDPDHSRGGGKCTPKELILGVLKTFFFYTGVYSKFHNGLALEKGKKDYLFFFFFFKNKQKKGDLSCLSNPVF